jgi:uncharacterized protein (DUF362 family)/Pyruvate/2-oxoacid:ferredoxin oxidoreductase delta subunit
MNNKVAIRKCREYDLNKIYGLIEEIYFSTEGPEVKNKKVLVKPNILTDDNPVKCISTHPVFVEAMVSFLQNNGATVFVGDSPAVHSRSFRGEKSGISRVCERTAATWVDFTKNPIEKKFRKGKIKIASIVNEVDLIISLPKFKTHDLVYFTGAIKNTLGLVPGFTKAKQHALHQNRNDFGAFLVDLNEAVLPDYFIMDGITGMQGPGPANGIPVETAIIAGSSNPLALDMTASRIAGYDPMIVPTSRAALFRKVWLKSEDEIIYDGPDLETIIKRDFKKVPVTRSNNIALQFLMRRIKILRKLERRPVFIHENCTGCLRCIRICPVNAIEMHPRKKNFVVLTDSKCIRCFCCSEVCQDKAVEIRRKAFGV